MGMDVGRSTVGERKGTYSNQCNSSGGSILTGFIRAIGGYSMQNTRSNTRYSRFIESGICFVVTFKKKLPCVDQYYFALSIDMNTMNRRGYLFAAGSSFAGIAGYLATFNPLHLLSSSGKLIIECTGDVEPETRRTISVTVGTYSFDQYLRSSTTPPEWNNTILFQELYRLAPGEQVQPEVFVGDPGQYRLDIWVQDRGTTGTQVRITNDGTLANAHRVTITASGIEHSFR